MKHNKKKLLIILAELMKLFIKLGCTNITVNFDLEPKECIIKLRAKYDPAHKDDLKCLESALGGDRNIEMEEYYWSISGSAEINQGSELYVVSAMLDKCIVAFDDEYVEITAHREL